MKRTLSLIFLALFSLFSCGEKDLPTIEVDDIILSIMTDIELTEGGSKIISVTISPEDASDQNIIWKSSNPTVASVVNGLITAFEEGETTITATSSNDISASVKIIVSPKPAESIAVQSVSLDKETLSLVEGDTQKLTADVKPDDATEQSVSWSSNNPDVAIVDNNGLITALEEGKATITVTTTEGEKTAICDVTVTKKTTESVEVQSVSLDRAVLLLYEDDISTLTAEVIPTNATEKGISWSSNNPDVAIVDQNGKVVAVSEGTAIITVITDDGGKTATCTVNITKEPIKILGITLNKTTLSIEEKKTEKLVATIDPSTVTNKAIIWKSNRPDIATVDKDGVVMAILEGNAIISATTTDGSMTTECYVTVTPEIIPVTGISLNKNSLTLTPSPAPTHEPSEYTLAVIFSPTNPTNKDITWMSSDEKIASVNASGLVTAHHGGKVAITATSIDGEYSATCEVIVKTKITGADILLGGIVTTGTKTIKKGDKLDVSTTLLPTIVPEGSSLEWHALDWASGSSSILVIDSNESKYTITGNEVGTTTLTLKVSVGTTFFEKSITINVSTDPSGIKPPPVDIGNELK